MGIAIYMIIVVLFFVGALFCINSEPSEAVKEREERARLVKEDFRRNCEAERIKRQKKWNNAPAKGGLQDTIEFFFLCAILFAAVIFAIMVFISATM